MSAVVISMTCLMAQNTQGTALDKLCSALSQSCVCLDCAYSFDMSEIRFNTEADIKVQGRAYVVDCAGVLVFSDGETVWTVDPNIKEAYIQSSGNEMLNDPAIFSRIWTSTSRLPIIRLPAALKSIHLRL